MRIQTVRDARIEKLNSDDASIVRERRELKAELERRVARWETKVAEFGGKVHIDTLARLRAELAKLN